MTAVVPQCDDAVSAHVAFVEVNADQVRDSLREGGEALVRGQVARGQVVRGPLVRSVVGDFEALELGARKDEDAFVGNQREDASVRPLSERRVQ